MRWILSTRRTPYTTRNDPYHLPLPGILGPKVLHYMIYGVSSCSTCATATSTEYENPSAADPLSDSLLSTMHIVPATEKKKRAILLHNPTVQVDMTFTGKINFRWQFTWEDHTFEFKRDGEHDG